MIELTLATLLNSMSADFCSAMKTEKDVVKSVLVSYSIAHDKYGGTAVRKVIKSTHPLKLKTLAVSSVITKCPNRL